MKKSALELVVLAGHGKNSCHRLGADRVVLGRESPGQSGGAELLLFSEPTVSRVHAVLEWDDRRRRYLVTNHSSTNPTLLNGARLSRPTPLQAGDQLRMGNLVVELRVGVGQHVDDSLEGVDVASLIRSAAALVPEQVQWVAHTPIPRPHQEPTPLPAFLFETATPALTEKRQVALDPLPETGWSWSDVAQDSGLELIPAWSWEEELRALPTTALEEAPAPEASEPAAEVSAPTPPEPEPTPVAPQKPKPYRRTSRKIGRNERCPCGSGIKYKKCCGSK